ncbi:retrovirus-related Pol polyprotein from transposon 297 [Trichonephila clavipes]|nr:retrovirus-related Pol polyprotein from transposon 297 [Trichonephila clavipes]
MRLCIDYRKLNAQTVPDTYPLPRMDDLLNEAKPTPYMSTIDLRSGYHQVKVAAEVQDKTAFTCPFGIYKFNRMPFGLRNAHATFQRLIDKFRSGLNNVLSYLDDIIILSPTFQKHLSDPEQVFKRLSLFKLNANRKKCNFCYLQDGHYRSNLIIKTIDYIPGRSNFIADLLSRPTSEQEKADCDILAVFVDFPTRSPKEVRQEQKKDDELKKIIECFKNNEKSVNFANWLERGYLMNQGILFRYSPTSKSEEAQLVMPIHERQDILKIHHDAPKAGHYGANGTFESISKRYYWTGMRSYITDYVKNCTECNRYKPSNKKPSGLLRTPVYSQRFETISIDLFGTLPESPSGKKWIFIVEDCCTRWVELFALPQATAIECATALMEEVILRYGLPRRLISVHGSQFVVQNRHDEWEDKLPSIRFALNSAKCDTTGKTAAYLQFGREMRTIDDVTNDFRAVIYIDNKNFVPEITPYLKRLARISSEVRERIEEKQDQRKTFYDKRHSPGPLYPSGDKVWVTLHPLSNAAHKKTAKFMPKKDGLYIIVTQRSPTTYEVANPNNPHEVLGPYLSSALRPCIHKEATPVMPLRKRGRPRKDNSAGSSSRTIPRNQRRSVTNGNRAASPCRMD